MFAIKSSRVFFVEASAPKNFARMSLSIPRTCAPSLAKRRTVSEPINPAEPVTMIVRTVVIVAQPSWLWGRQASCLSSCSCAGETPARPTARMAVLLRNYPCHFACAGIHSRGGKFLIAREHTLDEFGIFRGAHEKQNMPGMIDERKCERQPPRI